MVQKFDSRQTVSRDALPEIVNAAGKELDDILRSADAALTVPFVMRESAAVDGILHIGSISLTNSETGRNRTAPPISSELPVFLSGTVTLSSTGAGNATPSVGVAVPLGMSASQVVKILVSIESTGDIQLSVGDPAVSEALAIVPAPVSNTHSVGYFVVTTDGSNNTSDVTAATIYQFVGGGGGGSGSGDASSVITRLWDEFSGSIYEEMSGIDFSADADAHVDGASTGAYSAGSGSFEFDATGETFISTNMFSPDFLTKAIDIDSVSVSVFLGDGGAKDTNAVYAVSRDGGGEYQTITMNAVSASGETYEGIHNFVDEASNSKSISQLSSDGSVDLDAVVFKKSSSFNATNVTTLKEINLNITKTGSPDGFVTASIYSNNGGLPDELLAISAPTSASAITNGNNIFLINTTIPPGTHHVVISTDALYRASYSVGVTSLSMTTNTSSSGDEFDGSIWATASEGIIYAVAGRELDLRLRVTASNNAAIATKELAGFGMLYDPEASIAQGIKLTNTFEFLSNTDNTDTFDLGWVADPDLLEVYHIQHGQVYLYPAFTMSGTSITFPANSFQQGSDETVTLFAKQTDGTTFDNSDSNAINILELGQNLLENPLVPTAGPVLATASVFGAVKSVVTDIILADSTSSGLVKLPSGEIRVVGSSGTGHGSTNLNIRLLGATAQIDTGSSITYASSAASGSSFTINEDGIYSIFYSDADVSAAAQIGISKNSSQLTLGPASITATDLLSYQNTPGANSPSLLSVTTRLSSGDVLRPHDNRLLDSSNASFVYFHIVQVLKL